jgi:uncharacterized membrane protein
MENLSDLITGWLQALQASGPAGALRNSRWVYPLVNAGHIVGIALLFGAIVPLDLRLLGLWRAVPLAAIARIVVPVSIAGFLLAAGAGLLLFSVNPLKYAGMSLFLLKMGLITAALFNALLLRRTEGWSEEEPAQRIRLAAAASLALWLGIIICGRMLAYV